CPFCEKAFINCSFLHSHLQRRHPEESQTGQKRKAETDKLQEEMDKLKEQLQLTKSQLEAEQQANMVRCLKDCEQQKSKQEEILQLLHKWKEEEKEKWADELETVKEMIMKELKELSSRHSTLEKQLEELQKSNLQQKSSLGTLQDSKEFPEEKPQSAPDSANVLELLEKQESKWMSRVQALHRDHEAEKSLLLSEIEKVTSSVREYLKGKNSFYERRLEELGQRLQEENDLIIAQEQQIKELSRRLVESIKPCGGKYRVQEKADLVSEQAPLVCTLESIEELPEEENETEKVDCKPGRNNQSLRNALKTDPSSTKELRVVFEQALEEKLESLGIKAGVGGIPNDRYNEILRAVESARERKWKQEPDIHRIREHLERQVSFRVKEKSSSRNSPVSCPQLPSEDKQRFNQLGISSSATPRKPVKRSSAAVRSAEPRAAITQKASTPKPSKSKVGAFRKASAKSDTDGTQASEIEETGTPTQTSEGAVIQKPTEQVGKSLSDHENKNKPAGGIHVAQAFLKKEEVKEQKLTEVDDGDWDISTLEELFGMKDEDDWSISTLEEELFGKKDDRGQKALTAQKEESNAASVVHACTEDKCTKEKGRPEAGNTRALSSTLVTLTDWSDFSDI
ncbi:DZIP1 protein, partial [Chunga burmeisteri]|nr:DZIP1 protein [Chunga burmeisteri]